MKYCPSTFILLRMLAARYGTLLHFSLLISFDGILPLLGQRIFDWESSASGTVFIPLASSTLFGGLAGTLSDRFGANAVALIGFVYSSIMIALVCLVDYSSTQQVFLLCSLVVLTGSYCSP